MTEREAAIERLRKFAKWLDAGGACKFGYGGLNPPDAMIALEAADIRLLLDSEPPGWVEGPPTETEPGNHLLLMREGGYGVVTVPSPVFEYYSSKTAMHFRIPDPPKAPEPIPDRFIFRPKDDHKVTGIGRSHEDSCQLLWDNGDVNQWDAESVREELDIKPITETF